MMACEFWVKRLKVLMSNPSQIPSMATRKKRTMRPARRRWNTLGIFFILAVLAFGLYQIPSVKARAKFYFNEIGGKIFYMFRKPEEQVFQPQQTNPASTADKAGKTEITETQTPVKTPVTATRMPSQATSVPSPMPTQTPLAVRHQIRGIEPESQGYNNCGPTNLSMYLNFWGENTNQDEVAAVTHRNPDDRNVSIAELQEYAETETSLKTALRYGGTIDLLERFVNAGLPVMIERGYYGTETKSWAGHYGLITGYDREKETLHIPDSYLGDRDFRTDEITRLWDHFARVYLIVYPADREAEVKTLLGEDWDEASNLAAALTLMTEEAKKPAPKEYPEDTFFAQYAIASLQIRMKEFEAAASTYDEAFKIYQTIPSYKRPFRALWYEFGPYEAYYETKRYEDCISLAQNTLGNSFSGGLAESWYWRGKCSLALDKTSDARYFFEKAIQWNPPYPAAQQALDALPK